MILLNPGPVVLSERVRAALTRPDLCHREPEFAQLQTALRERLLALYDLDPKEWAAVLMTGSGTAAMEAMVSSLVPPNGHLLVVENGVYGERLSEIAQIHGIATTALTQEWGEAVDLACLRGMLVENPAISHLALVHHETTTGRLNDVTGVAELCSRFGVHLLLDAVSSFGAEALPLTGVAADPVIAVAATANKCLHGIPGAAFVLVRRDHLPDVDTPRRTLYLDLARYCAAQDREGTPFTQSVPAFYALDEALDELIEAGGIVARQARYRALAEQVRTGLARLDITPLLPAAESSVVLVAYHLPKGIDYNTLHDHLKRAGFVIYAGQGGLSATIFRISTMGEIDADDIDRLLVAMAGLPRS